MILQPGPDKEIRTVNLMYQWLIEEDLRPSEIAGRLNGMGLRIESGRRWRNKTVREVLTNEKYIGNNVFNRESFKLKKRRVTNSPPMWIRKDGAFEPVVAPEVFYTAQAILEARAARYTDGDMLERLRALYEEKGTLSSPLIDEARDMPSARTFSLRFNGLERAYELVGFTPKQDFKYLQTKRQLRPLYPGILQRTIQQIAEFGGTVCRERRVTALPNGGFETEGRQFKSLSAAARHITGCQVSGPAFFGFIKTNRKPK